MIVTIERHGGLAGMQTYAEMDSRDLPTMLVTRAKKIIEDENRSKLPLKVTAKGSADHYNYKISIQDGTNKIVLEYSEHNIPDDLKSLVKYVEKNSAKIT
jgi:hypothetical protein